MTHYNENPGMVRVDYFKPSGKWYMTEAIDMSEFYDQPDIHAAVHAAMSNHWVGTRSVDRVAAWRQFTIVVLEPYHVNAYPIMIRSKDES